MALSLELTENSSEWEKFLLRHSPNALFQSWEWGEVQQKAGETVYRYVIKEGTTVVGLAQIFVTYARRGAFLHVRHGPIWTTQSKSYWREFIRIITVLAKKEGAWFVRVSPLIDNTREHRLLMGDVGFCPAPIHEVDAERCWVLDLDKTEEQLLMGMRKTTRYEIRLAQKSEVAVRTSTDPKDLKYFFALYEDTSKRHGFVAHPSITEEFEVFAGRGQALLFLGYHQKRLIAAAIVLFFAGEAMYHHGASVSSKVPVSYLVQWEAIREAKKRAMRVYNFYGIAPEDKPNHPWRGITLFKKGFGGREINFIHSHDLPVSPLYVIPRTIEAIRTKMRGY